jgi:hypothetical protein
VIYSDDFLMKHEQIAALDDTIQQGKDMLAELGENVSEEAQVSDEMLTALRDIHGN